MKTITKYKSKADSSVSFWAEANKIPGSKVESYTVLQQAEGFPATEATDDWLGTFEDADEIARTLAEGTGPGTIPATVEDDAPENKEQHTTETISKEADLLTELEQFTGSEEWHRWSALFRRDLLTDGAKYVSEKCGAFWLMDLVASWQGEIRKKHGDQPFQVWTLTRYAGEDRATARCTDGNEPGTELAVQEIEYTDFPGGYQEPFKLFAARNEIGGFTIMLPSEN